jgi:DNA-binding Lrp family transcriptional regulator
MQLDAIDLRILDELQRDGALSNVELARRVHLSPSPCLSRVKVLETSGVIDRYVALANAEGASGSSVDFTLPWSGSQSPACWKLLMM